MVDKKEIIEVYNNVEQIPNNGCVRYEKCGNVIPGTEKMCPECLDKARAAQRNDEELNWNV